VNPSGCEMLGMTREEVLNSAFTDVLAPEEVHRLPEAVASFDDGKVHRSEWRFRRKDGSIFIGELLARKLSDGRLQGVVRDVTERKQVAERLAAVSEELRQTLEIAPTGITRCSRDLRYVSANPAYAELYGRPLENIVGRSIVEVVGNETFNVILPYIERALAGETVEYETEIRVHGRATIINVVYVPDRDSRGLVRGWAASVRDVTARRRAEEQLRLVMREVNHRSKNLLAVVQAIARQTAAANPVDFVDRFEDRVNALAVSLDLLVKNEWKGANLEALVRSQLAHFEGLIGTRIELQGPPLFVTASAAQAIGMALHKLATNAGKYGALADGGGRVVIEWSLERASAGASTFVMAWREQGMRTLMPPSNRGFGSTVICDMAEMSLDATVELDFPATGLVWRLQCPVGQVLSEGGSTSIDKSKKPADSRPLANKNPRILVVEDEAVVALEVAQMLVKAGFEVVGPARSVSQALRFIKEVGCDAAVLDINLGDETSEPVALELIERGTPFMTLSGYSREQHSAVFNGAPMLAKPLQPERLIAEVQRCIEQGTRRTKERAGLPVH
jgi:PAS domain S-box-containing protein